MLVFCPRSLPTAGCSNTITYTGLVVIVVLSHLYYCMTCTYLFVALYGRHPLHVLRRNCKVQRCLHRARYVCIDGWMGA